MELNGYTKTDIGVLPHNWDVKPLSELTVLMTNGFVGTAKSHYTNSDEGVVYIQGYNVKENSFNFHGIKRVTEDFHKKHKKSNLKEGDLLTVQTGDIGLTTFVTKELEGANCHALIISRFNKSTAYSKFFSYYLNSHEGRSRLREIETGSTMKHINVGDMVHFLVPLPPLSEQKAIAEVLSDTDNLIQSLEKQIAKKRLIKQGTMQKLLSPKEGWEEKQIGELAEVIGGGTPSTTNNNFWNGTINWFTPTEIGETKYVRKSLRKITNEGLNHSSAQLLPVGTILLTSRAGIGDLGITLEEACTNQGFQSLVSKKGVNNEFLYYLMLTKKEVLLKNASGSTFLEISPRMVRQIVVYVPDYIKQKEIALILSDIDNEIELLSKKISKYVSLKRGLMQNLLTGKIRLK